MRKSASEGALSMKGGGRRDSPLSALFGMSERSSEISYDWVKPMFESYSPGLLEHSGKFVLLFQIIEETLRLGEKLLVFSQSLMTLNLLEEFLSKTPVPLAGLNGERWARNQTYYRLDGSTNASERERLINQFNSLDNREACLFLLSTKAGCLGINLIGANRVVVLDASWNPCHDCQAVCRVYRYGQCRPCFIYRFVTDNTMEKKIYDRQVTKQGMADRVVDEIQVQSQFSKKENDQLLEYQDHDMETMDATDIEQKCFDPVLVKVIKENHHWITQNPFIHESLLIEAQDQKMTRNDKRLAKEMYEQEKKMSVSFSRPSYANYYQNKPPPPPPVFRGPSLPPMNQDVMPRPNLITPQMRHNAGAPPPYDFRQNVAHQIRPGVTVQTIQAHKDIVVPGPECRVIKQGELLTVIRTPKGSYIKLTEGKIFAIRNRKEAENFGLADGNSSSGSSPATVAAAVADPGSISNSSGDQMLSSLLQSNRMRHLAPQPNLVERRLPLPHTMYGSTPPSPHTIANGGEHGDFDHTMNASISSPFPSFMTDTSMTHSDGLFPLTHNNFYPSLGAKNNNNSVPPAAAGGFLSHYHNPPPSSSIPYHSAAALPYESGGGGNMASGYHSQLNPYSSGDNMTAGWGGACITSSHPDPLGINGTLPTSQSVSSTSIQPPLQQQQLQTEGGEDKHSLPNLGRLLRLQTPLVLPPLDAVSVPANQLTAAAASRAPPDSYDSDSSLPSLDDGGGSPGATRESPLNFVDGQSPLQFINDKEETIVDDNG